MNVPQGTPLGLLHDHTHGLCIAFVIPLHGPEHPDLGGNAVQPGNELPQAFRGSVSGFPAVFLPEGEARDDVVGGGYLLLGLFQLPAAVFQILSGLVQPVRSGGQIPVQLRQTGPGCLAVFLNGPDLRLAAGNIRGQGGFPGPQLQKLPVQALGGGGHFAELLLGGLNGLANIQKVPVNLLHPPGRLVDLALNTAGPILLAPDFLLNAGNILIVVVHVAPEYGHLALQLLVGALEHGGFHPDGFQMAVLFPEGFPHFLRLAVEPFQIIVGLLQHKGRGSIVLLRLFGSGGELVQGIQPDGYLHPLKLFLQLQVFLRLFGLGLQGLQLQLQLGYLIPDPQQIVLRPLQLALGLLFPVAVFGDAGGLLKDLPAVAAFQGENLVNTALADVGIALPAQARVHQQLVNVPKAGGLTVDIVFPIAGAIIAAGHHHLIGIIGKGPVPVVQGQGRLREAQLGALGGAAEDHILHFRAPEGLGALFAHYPQNGIGNIGFSGAVGTHNGRNIVAKADHRLIREGLKALQFQ